MSRPHEHTDYESDTNGDTDHKVLPTETKTFHEYVNILDEDVLVSVVNSKYRFNGVYDPSKPFGMYDTTYRFTGITSVHPIGFLVFNQDGSHNRVRK